MTLEEFAKKLTTIGIPVARFSFNKDKRPSYPFIIYEDKENLPFGADNTNYFNRIPVTIELYTSKKNKELEQRIIELLEESGFFYTQTDDFGKDARDQLVYLASFDTVIY